MSTHCEEWLPLLLKAAEDVALDPRERTTLDAHLAGCAACAEALADQRAMRAALVELRVAPATMVGHRVMAELRHTQAPAEGLAAWFDALDWKRWTWRLVPVAAALALAVANVARPAVDPNAAVTTDETEAATTDTTDTPASAVLFSEDVSAQDLLSLLLSSSADATVTTGGGR